MTVDMQANLLRMKSALYEWLVKEDFLGDAEFYTTEEWRARKEEYLTDSLLILVIDSSPLHTILNHGGDTVELEDLVESFGFYYEMGHSWNLGFYPLEGYDYSRSTAPYAIKLSDARWKSKAQLVKERARYICQDCHTDEPLEAHHCYYTSMREGYEPWEYPLSALRALCKNCHKERERAEIRMRAFMASMTRMQMDALRPALSHATYLYEYEAVFSFLSELGPENRDLEIALEGLKSGRKELD